MIAQPILPVAGDHRPVVVVTSANRGIGLEVVRQCAAHEMDVVLGCRDVAKGRAGAQRLGLEDRVLVRALDVTSQRDVDALADELVAARLVVAPAEAALHACEASSALVTASSRAAATSRASSEEWV